MTESNPGVIVILPVYNGEPFVRGAIQSIQAQTFQNWELIIVNDGSTDQTLAICEECARQEKRIQVCSNEKNLGLAKTMNRLVQLAVARGAPYIAIQEADDYSLPERLALEVGILDTHQDVGIVSGIAEWVEELGGKPINYFPGMLTKNQQFPQDCRKMVTLLYTEQSKVVNAACMFRQSLVVQIPEPFDPEARISIDWQFFVRMAHKCHVYGLPAVLIQARRGSSHASLTSKKELQYREARRCIRILYKDYKGDPASPINYWLYRKAMATELIIEGRYYGGMKGGWLLLQAAAYDPTNRKSWTSLKELFLRAMHKIVPKT